MTIVVDASIASAWLFAEQRAADLIAIARSVAAGGASAPALFVLEVRNVILMYERRKRIDRAMADRLLDRIGRVGILIDERGAGERISAVVEIARHHSLTVYDATYLELARRLGARLASLDAQLRAAAAAEGIQVLP